MLGRVAKCRHADSRSKSEICSSTSLNAKGVALLVSKLHLDPEGIYEKETKKMFREATTTE